MRVVVYNMLLKVQQIIKEVHYEGGIRLSSENNIAFTKLWAILPPSSAAEHLQGASGILSTIFFLFALALGVQRRWIRRVVSEISQRQGINR